MTDEQNICYNCKKSFNSLSKHWSLSTCCDYKDMSEQQIEILTGVLMGDGCVDRKSSKNWSIICTNTNRKYLEYLSDRLGFLTRGLRMAKTSYESAQSSEFVEEPNPDNYNNIYRWVSISHPHINDNFDWYINNHKRFPETISLTPTILRHWYCCDGHYEKNIGRVRISMSNERKYKDKISGYFKSASLPKPSGYNENDRTNGSKRCGAYWTVRDSEEILDYMGEPLPGFEYKWSERFK